MGLTCKQIPATLQHMSRAIALFLLSSVFPWLCFGQILVEDPAPRKTARVGESAARKYFQARQPAQGGQAESSGESSLSTGGVRFLNVYLGTFMNDRQYRWGDRDSSDDVGELIAGVSYRIGEWTNSMDLLFRGEFITYDVDGEQPTKLSLLPVITFPDAKSDFPLYFGAGLGVGIFFQQVNSESDLTLDYTLLAGLRDADLLESFGLSFELGYKGHIHLLSSGQFGGVYLTVGTVHEF